MKYPENQDHLLIFLQLLLFSDYSNKKMIFSPN